MPKQLCEQSIEKPNSRKQVEQVSNFFPLSYLLFEFLHLTSCDKIPGFKWKNKGVFLNFTVPLALPFPEKSFMQCLQINIELYSCSLSKKNAKSQHNFH